jgi:hypothetical protein
LIAVARSAAPLALDRPHLSSVHVEIACADVGSDHRIRTRCSSVFGKELSRDCSVPQRIVSRIEFLVGAISLKHLSWRYANATRSSPSTPQVDIPNTPHPHLSASAPSGEARSRTQQLPRGSDGADQEWTKRFEERELITAPNRDARFGRRSLRDAVAALCQKWRVLPCDDRATLDSGLCQTPSALFGARPRVC